MNRDKAKIVLTAIKADTERHDQTHWTNINATPDHVYHDGSLFPGHGTPKVKESEDQIINCGTTACLAGHTGFIFAPVGTKFYKDNMLIPTGRTGTHSTLISYEDFANQELELTNSEVNYLFSGHRELEEIEEYIEATDDAQSDILSTMYEEDND